MFKILTFDNSSEMNDYLTKQKFDIIDIKTNVVIMTRTPDRENNYTGYDLIYVLTIQFRERPF
jgi:hypothetical protein